MKETVHGFKAFIVMAGCGWVKPYPLSQGWPEVKYLLKGGVSGKENSLAKSSRPLGTSLKWRSVLSLHDHRSPPLPVRGLGAFCPFLTDGHRPLYVGTVGDCSYVTGASPGFLAFVQPGTKLPFTILQVSICP